jgi:hypothetical protein
LPISNNFAVDEILVPAVDNCTEDSDADELNLPAVANFSKDSESEAQPTGATTSPNSLAPVPKSDSKELVGARVTSTFAGTTHRGTVVDIDSDSNTGEPIYGVRYDDGDTADYTLAELSEKLVDPAVSPPPHVSDCTPCFIAEASEAAADLASSHRTPKHYGEVLRSVDKAAWLEAMDVELTSLRDMDCYELVLAEDVPKDCRIIGYTWVYRLKINSNGTISRYKARICVNGSQQRAGRDYDETFAPVCAATTIRLLLAIATHSGLHLRQFDIKLAFVSATLDRVVYMKSPAGSREPIGSAWRLKRCLYGLSQSPRLFNKKLHSVLITLDWCRCHSSYDPCLYFQRHGAELSLLAVVVDDLILAGDAQPGPR